ncbi:hypothetical protein AAZX31_14G107100 [Glycine max]
MILIHVTLNIVFNCRYLSWTDWKEDFYSLRCNICWPWNALCAIWKVRFIHGCPLGQNVISQFFVNKFKKFFSKINKYRANNRLSTLGINSYVKSAVSFWPHFRFSPSPLKTLSFSRSPPNQSQKTTISNPFTVGSS